VNSATSLLMKNQILPKFHKLPRMLKINSNSSWSYSENKTYRPKIMVSKNRMVNYKRMFKDKVMLKLKCQTVLLNLDFLLSPRKQQGLNFRITSSIWPVPQCSDWSFRLRRLSK